MNDGIPLMDSMDSRITAVESPENSVEVADLSGDVEVLTFRAVFNGPYSTVYRGKLRSNDELVAIKVLNPIHGIALHAIRRKINRERTTWSMLQHPNILPLYGFADDEDFFDPYGAFISPWRARGDLAQYLREQCPLSSLEERLKLWTGIVTGVTYLHLHNPVLIHGDLKPGNILIDDGGNAQICDFELVRVFLEHGNSGMTTTTAHTGTERYLAYELVVAETASPTMASDIYATGCIGLELITLQAPYSNRGNNLRWYLQSDMRAGIPPAVRPVDLAPELTMLWKTLSPCWARDPMSRPCAQELSEQLEDILTRERSIVKPVILTNDEKSGSTSSRPTTQTRRSTDGKQRTMVNTRSPSLPHNSQRIPHSPNRNAPPNDKLRNLVAHIQPSHLAKDGETMDKGCLDAEDNEESRGGYLRFDQGEHDRRPFFFPKPKRATMADISDSGASLVRRQLTTVERPGPLLYERRRERPDQNVVATDPTKRWAGMWHGGSLGTVREDGTTDLSSAAPLERLDIAGPVGDVSMEGDIGGYRDTTEVSPNTVVITRSLFKKDTGRSSVRRRIFGGASEPDSSNTSTYGAAHSLAPARAVTIYQTQKRCKSFQPHILFR